MRVGKWVSVAIGMAGAVMASTPAFAQFFFQPPNLRGAPVTGTEPGMLGQALPDATPAELRAAMVWNLRAALNVGALQCGFAPYLLNVDSYNQMIGDHADELKASYDTLTKYFMRTNKTKKAGQAALDTYGTRVYSSFSTVGAQLTFCQTSSEIGHAALFTPRGSFGTLAAERLREMRNSLVLAGEQRFPRGTYGRAPTVPSLDKNCWKKDEWRANRCGAQQYGGV